MTREAIVPSVALKFDSIRIYFGDTLHLAIKRSKLLGIQSWRYGDNNFFIEYTMDGGAILTEYDDREKFSAILKQLDAVL